MDWIVVAALGAAAAAAGFGVLWRKAASALAERGRAFEAKTAALDERTRELAEATSVANERGTRSQVLESELAQANRRQEELQTERDVARGAADAVAKDLAQLRADHAALRETLDQERKQSAEKLALLNEAKEQMKLEFKALADEVMKGHSTTFAEQNKQQMKVLLGPLREHIDTFQKELKTAHHQSTIERSTLAAQIQNLTQTSSTMLAETANLTRALKGEAQTQGAWGEMILESILERSGLREGEEYSAQDSHTVDGGRVRTDVIVKLPNGQRVVIDSKVSLTAFEGFVKAESDEERSLHLKAHLASLRGHIKTLSTKKYHEAAESGLDYVILFVPIEGALAAALQEDSALTAFAVENNVPIATPTTLMIALRTIANLWQVERRNRNADAIAERAGRLYDKFAGFVGDLQALGGRLDQAKKSYDGAMGKLSTGPGNIVRQIEQLRAMGAKTGKSLPATLVSEIEVEVTDDDAEEPRLLEDSDGSAAAE